MCSRCALVPVVHMSIYQSPHAAVCSYTEYHDRYSIMCWSTIYIPGIIFQVTMND